MGYRLMSTFILPWWNSWRHALVCGYCEVFMSVVEVGSGQISIREVG